MTSTLKVDVERVCRVCLQEHNELFLLFDDNYSMDGISMSQMLSECTMYKVERYDDLPHQICSVCMEAAKSAYNFKKRTENSYRHLVSLLKEVNCDHVSVDFERLEKSTQTDKLSIHPCELCDEKFFESGDLRDHRLEAHRGAIYLCKVCGKDLENLHRLKSHLALEHPQEGLTHDTQCNVCGKTFSRKDHVRRHIRNVHKALSSSDESRFDKSTLEEPEIDIKEEKDYLEFPEQFFNDNSLASDTHWTNDVENAMEADRKFNELHNDNPISTDHGCDEEDTEVQEKTSMRLGVDALVKEEPKEVKLEPGAAVETDARSGGGGGDQNCVGLNFGYARKRSAFGGRTRIIREYLEEKRHGRRACRKAQENRCSQCQRMFSRHCHLRRHMLTHLAEKPHECEQCQKRFTRRDHLKNHVDSMHRAKDFKCDQCSSAFIRNDGLVRHKELKHTDGPNPNVMHTCDFCDKSFTTKNYLRKHRNLHTDKVYACKHCDDTFKDRSQFREHEKTHNVERNFLCSICGDSFVRNDYLRVHMRRHTGEKPYKCQYCDKGFPRATDVKVHERYHTGHKPNLCTLCGKGFHRAYNLTIHMRTHTGERPFQCEHCPKSFAQSNDLKAHVRRHTGERFKCNTCNAGFLQLYGLRQHALATHGIQIGSTTGRLQKFPVLAAGEDEDELPPIDLQHKWKEMPTQQCSTNL